MPPNFKGKQKLVHLYLKLCSFFELIFHLWTCRVNWEDRVIHICQSISRYLIIYDPLFITGFGFASLDWLDFL